MGRGETDVAAADARHPIDVAALFHVVFERIEIEKGRDHLVDLIGGDQAAIAFRPDLQRQVAHDFQFGQGDLTGVWHVGHRQTPLRSARFSSGLVT
ncbi:MAG: hypothetical protein WDN06_00470 [Asticcacaulis sp.]